MSITIDSRTGVAAAGFAAVVVAAIAAGGGVVRAISTATADSIRVAIPAAQAPAPEAVASGGAEALSATFTSLEAAVAGLPAGIGVLLATGELLDGLSWAALALCIAYLCHRITRGDAFRPVATRTLWFGAGAMLVGPVTASLALSAGQALAIAELDVRVSHAVADWSLRPEPIAVAIVLAVLAVLFRSGERLQRETEGLV